MVSGYPTSTNLPRVDGLSTGPPESGCHRSASFFPFSSFSSSYVILFFPSNSFSSSSMIPLTANNERERQRVMGERERGKEIERDG